MAKPPQRDIIKMIFTNFINSLRPRQIRGNYMGEDYLGNKYYEIPPNPSIGKRKPSRWFEPVDKTHYNHEVTAEWEAWLRGRRDNAPTREELVQNLQIMDMKKRNAAKLDEQYGAREDTAAVPKQEKGYATFPKYDEYEVIPGKDPKEK